MTQIPNTQVTEVLRIFSDQPEYLFWRENDEDNTQLDFYINCSDLFFWGSADAELITSEKLGILYESKKDMDALDIPDYQRQYGLLFAARARGMRPQGAYYKYLHEATHPLFDACGPKRETGFGNPKQQPSVQTEEESVK